jgi:enamine deaminase RidA (YjgF/YER057c/UK114 family)
MSGVEGRLQSLGFELPVVAAPLAAYVPAMRSGNLIFTSGQLPTRNGELVASGIVGKDLTVEEAKAAAEVCALNAIAAVKSVLGNLDNVRRVVKVVGFVASTPEFTQQPAVINGASELFLAVFGDIGKHARSAVGVAALPINAPVEVELIVEVDHMA